MNDIDTTGLAAERLERIKEILKRRGVARVDELCRELGVSAVTVRRDLAELDSRGQVRRVHGGAVRIEGLLEEPVFDDKTMIAAKQKQAIAEKALSFIKPNDSIFLDGGSTVLTLARLLVSMNRLTVVTNSLRVACVLSGNGPRIILVGGELRSLSQTFVGALTEHITSRIHVDSAFMGTIGLSVEEGMTTTDPREAYTKDLLMERARQVILLADSSKVGKVSFVKFGSLEKVNILITDNGVSSKEAAGFRKKGIKVFT